MSVWQPSARFAPLLWTEYGGDGRVGESLLPKEHDLRLHIHLQRTAGCSCESGCYHKRQESSFGFHMCVDKSRQFGKELRLKSQFITLRANPEPASVRFWEWDCLVKYRIIPVNSTILSSLFNRFQSDLSSPPERMSAVRQAAVQISSLPTPKAKHPTTRGSFTRWCALAGSPVSI